MIGQMVAAISGGTRPQASLWVLRHPLAAPDKPYRGIAVDQERFRCTVNDKLVELTPVEFRILALLVAHPGRVFSRDRLMDVAYQDQRVVSDRTIDSHIRNLRSKLGPHFDGEEVIHSIYGVGYKVE